MANGLVVLISGKGSLLQAIIDFEIPVDAVIADRDCEGLDIARYHAIPVELLHREFGKSFDRNEFTQRLEEILSHYTPKLIVMAGFRTVLAPSIFEKYKQRILNIHPSLLPAFPGNNAVQDAIEYGVKIAGCTIHWATRNTDCGPILDQGHVRVHSGDTRESLHARINEVEKKIYPEVIQKHLDI